MIKSIHAFFALALVVAFLSGAGTSQAQNGESPQAQNGETPLRSADQLKITITGVPANDQQSMALQTYIVSNEGTIRLQHLKGEMRAVGLTPTALARTVETAYKTSKIYTNPAINVSRLDSATSVQMVSVSGNVRLGGSAVWRAGMRIVEAIAEKGGPDDFANMKKVRLVRGQKAQEMDLSNVSANPERNILLQPGDLIIVPAGGFFKK